MNPFTVTKIVKANQEWSDFKGNVVIPSEDSVLLNGYEKLVSLSELRRLE
jgi:hypothetical protein